MKRTHVLGSLLVCQLLGFSGLVVCASRAADLGGVSVRLEDTSGPATVQAEFVGPFKLRIDVEPTTTKPPVLRVELPYSGPHAWPVVDVEVRDSKGRAVVVRRSGIEWHKLWIPVPAARKSYFVQVVEPPGGKLEEWPEKDRHCTVAATGLHISIARWFDGRRAALSIRFDDSHPTHLSKAIPMLREYGFRGTFMINPGNHRAAWETVAKRGDQEFSNHSLHHRGAIGDEDMESEIGEASRAIWAFFPGKSKLRALNLGGGTSWETTHTLRYYLDKYHLFDASQNSTGMDDTYGNRVETFRRRLEEHIARGLWLRIHYHYIGKGLSSSEANLRAVLDIAREHAADVWIAGMSDIYKYETERRGSKLEIENKGARRVTLKLFCRTDPELYDQPLTVEAEIPQSWAAARVVVTNQDATEIDSRRVSTPHGVVLRFDVRPTRAEYTIEETVQSR
jgi:hypothetical protein